MKRLLLTLKKFHIYFFVLISINFFQCSRATDEKNENIELSTDSCCVNKSTTMNLDSIKFSKITCPHCGYKKTEEMPTDVCVIRYDCKNCNKTLYPKKGDCCVFCTYGTHRCPSMQE